MSEHIQPAPEWRPEASREHERPEEHERTPGVSHESVHFDFRLVIWVGIGLAVVAVVVHVAVWFLLGGLEKSNAVPPGRNSELALDEARQPLGQRVDNVPAPHLEGIERESSLLVVRMTSGEEKRFVTSVDVRVQIRDNPHAGLFELREGQPVTLAYYMPGGVGGGQGVVTSIISPPLPAGKKIQPGPEVPEVSRTFNAEIIKIEPRSIADARKWAEVQSERYGWIDREKEIVHIPVDKAMEEVLRSEKARAAAKKKKSAGGKR